MRKESEGMILMAFPDSQLKMLRKKIEFGGSGWQNKCGSFPFPFLLKAQYQINCFHSTISYFVSTQAFFEQNTRKAYFLSAKTSCSTGSES